MKLLPWDYLFDAFDPVNFPDIFNPIWMASLVLLVALIVLYVLRTRALHRHRLYLDMWEWIFWSGLITFFLLVVGAIFKFDFVVVLVIMLSGLGRHGLGEVPPLPAAVRGVRAPARPTALPRPDPRLPAGADDPVAQRPAARRQAPLTRRPIRRGTAA